MELQLREIESEVEWTGGGSEGDQNGTVKVEEVENEEVAEEAAAGGTYICIGKCVPTLASLSSPLSLSLSLAPAYRTSFTRSVPQLPSCIPALHPSPSFRTVLRSSRSHS